MTFTAFRYACLYRKAPAIPPRGALEPAKPDACDLLKGEFVTYCNSTTCPRKAEWGRG